MEASSGSIDSDCSNHDPKGYGGATMGARGQIFYMGIYMEEYFWKLSSKKTMLRNALTCDEASSG